MANLAFIEYDDGTNSLSEFLDELQTKHKNEEEKYILPFLLVIKQFIEMGPEINKNASKSFPPYKKLVDIDPQLSELRTKKVRFFILKIDKELWIGLCGYEKKSNDIPNNQISKVKGRIKLCKEKKTRK